MAHILPDSLAHEQHGEVAVLRLRRPAKRNAIDNETAEAIGAFFADLPPETKGALLARRPGHCCSRHGERGDTDAAVASASAAERKSYMAQRPGERLVLVLGRRPRVRRGFGPPRLAPPTHAS